MGLGCGPDAAVSGVGLNSLATELRRTRPELGVVSLGQYAERDPALELIESSSEGRAYLLKERLANRGELMHAI
jgi:hypothetical protein